MEKNQTSLLKTICLDCFLLICVGLPSFLVKRFAPVFLRGFFCHDEDLAYPLTYTPFNKKYFYATAPLANFIVIILTEFFRRNREKCDEKLALGCCKFPDWCYKAYRTMLVFSFGLLCVLLIVTVTKTTAGRLRPHFLEVCAPDIDCSLPRNQHTYHVHFNCTRNLDKPGLLKSTRQSFPSSHSSFFMYCAVFLAIYLQKRFVWKGSKLLKPAIQFLVIVGAWYAGVSRIAGYFHHWTDVIAGFIIGTTFAICAGLKIVRSISSSDITSTYI